MEVKDYPKVTFIMRGYTKEQAILIAKLIAENFPNIFAIEVTVNTKDAYEIIRTIHLQYSDSIFVGAGTIQTIDEAKMAIEAGAQFLLGPQKFTKEIFTYAKNSGVLSVPAAMTPSEVSEMMAKGADIVKVFPAAVVTPRFFKDIQAPLGKLPLMAVGGVTIENMADFFANDAQFVGLGSNVFAPADLEEHKSENIKKALQQVYQKMTEKE